MEDYERFIATKRLHAQSAGFEVPRDRLNSMAFEYQRDLTLWALRKARSLIASDCGTGKTEIELDWSNQVCEHTGGKVLILAPLSVNEQTAEEGEKFKINVNLCRDQKDVKDGINITNYEMLHHFDPSAFVGVVPDESSCMKDFTSKTRNQLIDLFQNTPYKLCCTATPSPNDFMELGNHAEFLQIMTRVEMLSMFFTHDGGDTSQWRLKGHAVDKFWEWVCTWAAFLRKPSDLGYSDEGFELPPIEYKQITVESAPQEGRLTVAEARTLNERRGARRSSLNERVAVAAELVNASDESWIVWCDLNPEGDALEKAINGAVQVAGRHTMEQKSQRLHDFLHGKALRLVSKASICGHGLNLAVLPQHDIVGLSDSQEMFYQAVRRIWRYGQKEPCNIYIITSEAEGAVLRNIMRKEENYSLMAQEMLKHTRAINQKEVHGSLLERQELQRGAGNDSAGMVERGFMLTQR
jgi:hypothetical protein